MVEELREKDRLVEYLRTGGRGGRAPTRRGRPRRGDGLHLRRRAVRRPLRHPGGARAQVGWAWSIGPSTARSGRRSRSRRSAPSSARSIPTLLERFKQELRLARRITHRNVVRTYDLGEADGIYFITMEYVRGTTVGAPDSRRRPPRRTRRRSRSGSRSAGRSRWPTRRASSIATSSRRTCWWIRSGS